MISSLKQLYQLLGSEQNKLPKIIALFFVLSILDVIGIGMVGKFIGAITQGEVGELSLQYYIKDYLDLEIKQEDIIVFASSVMLLIFLFKSVIFYIVSDRIILFSKKQRRVKQIELLTAYQEMDFLQFTERNKSEYVYAIGKLTGAYSNLIYLVLKTISDLFILLAVVIFLAYLNLPLFLAMVTLIAISIFVFDIFYNKELIYHGKVSNDNMKSLISLVNESMEGFKEIRVLGKQDFFLKEAEKSARKVEVSTAKMQLISLIPKIIAEMLLVLSLVIMIGMLRLLDVNYEEVIFLLGVYGVASIRVLPMSGAINSTVASIRQSNDSLNILFSDLQKIITKDPLPDVSIKEEKFYSLKVKNLCYKYPGNDNFIFENLSLEVKPKSVIGIVGESGLGKTTLVNLILGLLKLDEGSVLINDKSPIRDQSFIGYMSQDAFYIDGSILKNITLVNNEENGSYDENLVAKVIKSSRLDKLVSDSDKGVDMHIGEHGSKISGGQRQRLALARLLYFNRELLIMDEPTSAMDANTEIEILKELNILKNKKTMILISHNKKILELCDAVYEIKNKQLIKLNQTK